MRISIRPISDPQQLDRVNPNFIYNRFDLFTDGLGYEAVELGKEKKVLEYRVTGETAELGIRLMPMTVPELERLLLYIHEKHPQAKKVLYKDGCLAYGKQKQHNYFRVAFPATVEEMEERISPKSRAKFRRRNRRAEEKYGKMSLIEYENGNIPLDVVEDFFRYKLATRKRVYPMTAQEYLDRYHVTDCYVVKFGDTMGAMHFCCEQCPVVYGENHSYNPELQEYSLGKFIFAHSLLRMVEKGRKEILLAGGDFEYKTHYGSTEETVYDCEIDLSQVDWARIRDAQTLSRQVKEFAKSHLPQKLLAELWHWKNKLTKRRG